jgi:hypothetical protein
LTWCGASTKNAKYRLFLIYYRTENNQTQLKVNDCAATHAKSGAVIRMAAVGVDRGRQPGESQNAVNVALKSNSTPLKTGRTGATIPMSIMALANRRGDVWAGSLFLFLNHP